MKRNRLLRGIAAPSTKNTETGCDPASFMVEFQRRPEELYLITIDAHPLSRQLSREAKATLAIMLMEWAKQQNALPESMLRDMKQVYQERFSEFPNICGDQFSQS